MHLPISGWRQPSSDVHKRKSLQSRSQRAGTASVSVRAGPTVVPISNARQSPSPVSASPAAVFPSSIPSILYSLLLYISYLCLCRLCTFSSCTMHKRKCCSMDLEGLPPRPTLHTVACRPFIIPFPRDRRRPPLKASKERA